MRRLALFAAFAAASALLSTGCASAEARDIPAPRYDPDESPGVATAVLAGGCFWGLEAVFERVKGVRDVTSGYAGGRREDASYTRVARERTEHAEAVLIRFDPSQVSYGTLLHIYFSVTTDPTQLNRQGPDVGRSYRSAIFPQNAGQARIARTYIEQLSKAKVYDRPIVTRLESGTFFPAEAYHQDFMRRNPKHPYILAHDVPKVAGLKRLFPTLYRN